MTMLAIIRDRGFAGLRKAGKDPKQILPGIAAIAGGSLADRAGTSQSEAY
jgi:hypothetical protein